MQGYQGQEHVCRESHNLFFAGFRPREGPQRMQRAFARETFAKRAKFREMHRPDHSLGGVLGLPPWLGGCHIMTMGDSKGGMALAMLCGSARLLYH